VKLKGKYPFFFLSKVKIVGNRSTNSSSTNRNVEIASVRRLTEVNCGPIYFVCVSF
jgi:hypothetical protein